MARPANQIRTVQALRAGACLLVVAYHAGQGGWANGAAGVDLFFVISGLVMGLSASGQTAWDFAWHRVRRVVPLYWGLTLAKLAIGLALPTTLAAARPGPWSIVASFLFVPSRDGAGLVRPVLGVGWTLQFEMLFYVLFALALAWRRPPLRVLLPVLVPLALAGFWARPDWPAPLVLANGLVLEFCFGVALAGAAGRLRRSSRPAGLALGAVGLAVLLAVPSGGPWRCMVWGLPACAVVAAAVVLEPRWGGRVPGWLMQLGGASYAIYLVHPFLVPVVLRLAHLPGSAVSASLAVSTFGGLALDRWVDRPLQGWLRRRKQSFFEKKDQKAFASIAGGGIACLGVAARADGLL